MRMGAGKFRRALSFLCLPNFFSHALVRELEELRMRSGMFANFVPFRQKPSCNFRMYDNVGTYHKERHLRPAPDRNLANSSAPSMLLSWLSQRSCVSLRHSRLSLA